MVSRHAKACPNCGEGKPWERPWQRHLARILAVLVFAGIVWWIVSPKETVATDQPLTEGQVQAITAKIEYLDDLQDVAWWVVNGDGIHIGVYTEPLDSPAKHTDILNGAVGWGTTALDRSKTFWGFLYEADEHEAPGLNGEGALCRSEGLERVENTRCLIDGEWTSHHLID